MARADTTSDIDGLFQLPLEEFTAARNALAARSKKAGRVDEAERVRTLGKPPVSTWAVNQLYWRHRQRFDRLIASGERFRKAQAAQLAGKAADLQAALNDRREALLDVSKLAASVLRESGHTPSPEMMRRINTTLEALATYGAHPDAPEHGRLTDDLAPPGFEALAALVPRAARAAETARGPHGAHLHPTAQACAAGTPGLRRGVRKERSRVLPFASRAAASKGKGKERGKDAAQQHKAERARATAALRDAERALKQARKAAKQAETALKQAAARAKTAEEARRELEARFEKASAAAEHARQQARGVAAQAEDAAQAVADAERSVDAARRRLDDIDASKASKGRGG